MNADKKLKLSIFIRVHPRKSAAKLFWLAFSHGRPSDTYLTIQISADNFVIDLLKYVRGSPIASPIT